MFYLSKRFGSLVNEISSLGSTKPRIHKAKLSFALDLESGHEIVERTSGLIPRGIGKRGNEFAYITGEGLGKLTGIENGYAEEAKGEVIEAVSRMKEEVDMGLFGTAREIAARSLLAHMGKERVDFIAYLVAHDTVGYGAISMLMEDKQRIEEIEINAPCAPISIFHVDYGRCLTNLRFTSEASFRHNINKFIYDADKELGDETPIIDAQVDDARVHAQIRPYAQSGAVASIRLANNKLVCFDYLVKRGTADYDALAYIWLAIDSGMNMLIAGPPASGKTTMMSALFAFIPRVEKIVTIEEDVNELKIKIDMNNSVSLCGTRRGMATNTREQVINALRLRPDRLVVGEVRGEETRELFAGANLGIPFITTMHSNEGGIEIVKKLMVKPMDVETRALSSLDLALYMRHVDLSKRVLENVYEYRWLSRAESEKPGVVIEESDSVDVAETLKNGKLAADALQNSKVIEAFSRKKGLPKKLVIKELGRRAEFLKVVHESCRSTTEMLEKIQGYGW
jgi:type IV secretory pathway ATPase VirB11/archaellum biosynthesis ATPase